MTYDIFAGYQDTAQYRAVQQKIRDEYAAAERENRPVNESYIKELQEKLRELKTQYQYGETGITKITMPEIEIKADRDGGIGKIVLPAILAGGVFAILNM